MKIDFTTDSAVDSQSDCLVFCILGDLGKDSVFNAVDRELGGFLQATAKAQRFVGGKGQQLVVHSPTGNLSQMIVVLGAGPKKDFVTPSLRDLSAVAARLANAKGCKSMTFVPPALGKLGDDELETCARGIEEGLYRFVKYKTDAKSGSLTKAFINTSAGKKARKPTPKQARELRAAIKRGVTIGTAVNRARDWVNEPAGSLTPSILANQVRAMGRQHPSLTVKVLGRKECERLGMGMYLAVGQGSEEESKFIHVTYKPKKKATRKICLVGKGVTFDSGGYSLKPSASMLDMKIDMAGSAAVLASMGAIAELKPDVEVHAVAACCENLVSGGAYKLGDVLTGMGGATVEINNTDAEGRLTLADALVYAQEKIKPDEILDFATLTGACMVALGPLTAALFSDDEKMAKKWLAASDDSGEKMWRMPLDRRLKDQLKSSLADLRNTGERWGGAITAALFLNHFIKDTPWIHVDIAGPADSKVTNGAIVRGGTGFPVATILRYVTS